MNRMTFDHLGQIRPTRVVLVGLGLSAIALVLDLLIVGAASAAGEVAAFGPVKALLASVPAVLGNALGFYMSYRAPHPRALTQFLAPAGGFFLAFMVPPVWALLGGGNLETFAVAALRNVVPVAIAVPALLAMRPEAGGRTPVPAAA